MRVKEAWRRLSKDEHGFTLPEMLVTMLIMVVVLFALYNIFDTSIRVFSFGNDKVEAVENARLGLERMERELRGAYAVDRENGRTHLFFNATGPGSAETSPFGGPFTPAAQITFGNEMDAAGASSNKVLCTGVAGSTCEYMTYKLVGSTLVRNNTATGSTSSIGNELVVEFVQPGGLIFTYLESDGTALDAGDTEAQIARMRVELRIQVPGNPPRTQVLTTDVDLRNRL